MVGGTLLDRPEDIDIDPLTGDVYVTLTNNLPKGNVHGSIMKILEDSKDKTSLTFNYDTFLDGGNETGFSCPDNMAFDANGNFWFTSDISGSLINRGPYVPFGNNGLFFVPVTGPDKGQVIQVASAPRDAEFTGPWFSPDGATLFLSVQHPGERSKSLTDLSSNWPNKEGEMPQPAVITLQGPLLDAVSKIS
jgi:secreted PhoX family phosphatase